MPLKIVSDSFHHTSTSLFRTTKARKAAQICLKIPESSHITDYCRLFYMYLKKYNPPLAGPKLNLFPITNLAFLLTLLASASGMPTKLIIIIN